MKRIRVTAVVYVAIATIATYTIYAIGLDSGTCILDIDCFTIKTLAIIAYLVVGILPLLYLATISYPKAISKRLVKSVYETFPLIQADSSGVFRVTFYTKPCFFFLYYYLRNGISGLFKGKRKKRFMKLRHWGKYLVSYARDGIEGGNRVRNTSKSFLIRSNGNATSVGFAGLVYDESKVFVMSIDNDVVNKITPKIKKLIEQELHLLFEHDKYINESVQDSITRLKKRKEVLVPTILENELDDMIDFMEKTNTNAHAFMDISEGQHSNHFLGFKVYKGSKKTGGKLWGVVVIDITDTRDFYEICLEDAPNKENAEDWLHFYLESLSKIFSNSIA